VLGHRRFERHAAKHLADGRGDSIQSTQPEKPHHANFLVVCERPANLTMDDIGHQTVVGKPFLFRYEATQEMQYAAQRRLHFLATVGMVRCLGLFRPKIRTRHVAISTRWIASSKDGVHWT